MKNILKKFIRKIIKEEIGKEQIFGYCSTQVNLPKDLQTTIINWAKENLKDDELYYSPSDKYIHGIEEVSHVTILYGIHNVKDIMYIRQLMKLSKLKKIMITIEKLDSFKAGTYDVLILNVSSPSLKKLHTLFRRNIENSYSFEKYDPHVTVAYVKKGVVEKFLDKEIPNLPKSISFDTLYFTDIYGGIKPITFNIEK